MKQQRAVSKPYPFPSSDVEGSESLAELALDLRWSWNHAADEIWIQLDPALWELTHNPWVVLQTVSRDRIEQLLGEPAFREKVETLVKARREESERLAWFQQSHPEAPLTSVAYFSMEFMLSEALPIYSGGLGNVAGDQLKTASDLGVPVVGVGLLYQQGYFRQEIDKDGSQRALFPYNDPGQLPIVPLREANGEWLRLQLRLPGYSVWMRAWQVQVGRVKLYLLDSNDAANYPSHRGITSELYGGDTELRLKQEIALGIGGWRLLKSLGLRPEVCHLNEGHAAFAVLERARNFMEDSGQPFDVALAATRAGNLFTTHTPVAAGFDRFPPALIEQYLGGYASDALKISLDELLALGRQNPSDQSEAFNMAFLAMRGSGAVNGVSRLHGKVSRRIFQPLFPRWPQDEVPVGHVTNGIHTPTWDSIAADDLWTRACRKDRWLTSLESLKAEISRLPDSEFWEFRGCARKAFVEFVRERLARQRAVSGASPDEIDEAKLVFDPNALTLGFARRFAAYKRPTLLLHDPDRLLQILSNPNRPVQLVIAGKAHPADRNGQDMIREWTRFIARAEAREHVVFLSDYDMLLTARLVQGVDVWLNTPRRPWEASGTSGMKVLVNGGLNLSELDGWWAEAYAPEVGWALGDGNEHNNDPAWDADDANTLYTLLESEVIPAFFTRDEHGIPAAWVARMRESMASLTPRFSANRTVREYTEEYYLPASAKYRARSAGNGEAAVELVNWRKAIERDWNKLRFGQMDVSTGDGKHSFSVRLYLGGLDPAEVQIELYADGLNNDPAVPQEMVLSRQLVAGEDGYVYQAQVAAERPVSDYTPRVIPRRQGVSVPLEADQILWQR